ncbi:Non-heme 11 kDa protein of cytochrome bc1 complex [Mycena olivaceomarginata]|nr:Non-heme 11 kDa protein of cytochrome bc1 complex [Mycena olivaceomarginata]
MSGLGSFLSSFFPTTHTDSKEEEQKPAANEEAPKKAEAEEEEPEDGREHPKIRTDCEVSPACAPLEHRFEKCQEKVNAGEGYKGEDCVDGMFHMMHCSEACAAPKLFSKLR